MMNKLQLCHDCGAKPGEPHDDGCDVERCSVCGGQRLQCDCAGHDKQFAIWTGIWPGKAEADYLGVDLNEFDVKYSELFFVKSSTGEHDEKQEPVDFGDYVLIEQHRFAPKNEMYVHKVIGRVTSNSWVEVPVRPPFEESRHGGYADCVACICCGVCEEDVRNYRICDVVKC